MYGDIVEIADFSTFCHKYQVQILRIDKKHPWALHKYPLELFQSFSEFHRCPPGLTGAVSGADFAKNQHFELLWPLQWTKINLQTVTINVLRLLDPFHNIFKDYEILNGSQRGSPGVTRAVSGAYFAENQHFELLWPLQWTKINLQTVTINILRLLDPFHNIFKDYEILNGSQRGSPGVIGAISGGNFGENQHLELLWALQWTKISLQTVSINF